MSGNRRAAGFNVYSIEVEQALLAHPDIQDCAVIGCPDDKWDELSKPSYSHEVGDPPTRST
ncbi:AMP-binding enzyme [Gordonia jinghuaiqii]|uniref:AMP-binding enzyme n=1 Tax=Gordonia jinghuaiqii TaxID=2758710 RepID=UPI001C611829|nr:hypothetical protein [Gordonia jinghuaiqii]